ncbi:MAG: DUF5777 family beta-barrel protein [Cytophagaceae bacterium]|nr:DUF5777 family beta-barrel protein [Cytophagaceae bacterium]
MKLLVSLLVVGLLIPAVSTQALAQDDLMDLLNIDSSQVTRYTAATFKAIRIINGHSVETTKAKHLDFVISHRFDRLNKGPSEFFGLDYATLRLGFEYGLNDRLMIGVGRSSIEKTYDFFGKARLLRQSSGARRTPLSVTAFGSLAIDSRTPTQGGEFRQTTDRYVYCGQLLIARKFSDRLSLQISPTVLHRNRIKESFEQNTLVAVGVGGRFKLSKRISLNAEYYFVPGEQLGTKNQRIHHDALAVGFDIETGGHVFQLHFTNSFGMIEKQFIGQTGDAYGGRWQNGDIHWGFNLARTFNLGPRLGNAIR